MSTFVPWQCKLSITIALILAMSSNSIVRADSTSSAAAPSPAPFFLPIKNYDSGDIPHDRKAVYVIAVGADPATRGKFITALTRELAHYDLGQAYLQPETDWDGARFADACQKYPKFTQGALLIALYDVSNYSQTIIVLRLGTSAVASQLFYISCGTPTFAKAEQVIPPTHPSATPTPSPPTWTTRTVYQYQTNFPKKIVETYDATPMPTSPMRYAQTWNSDVVIQHGHNAFFNLTEFTALVLAGVSIWGAVTPSRTTGASVTTSYPTPNPGFTVPPSGFLSSVVNTNQKVLNPSQLGSISTALLSSSLTDAQNVVQTQTNDHLLIHAAEYSVKDFAKQLACSRNADSTPKAAPSPVPTPGFGCRFLYYGTL